MKHHDWTSKAIKNEPLTNIDLESFLNHSTVYCDLCGHVSELSLKFNQKINAACKDLELK